MRTTTLYKRNAKNKIVVWSITDNDNNTLSISHGIISCKKILPCGHKCFGVNGEITCPPCLVRECKQFGG